MSSEQSFILRERTIVFAGPFTSICQGLFKKFTSLGADCLHLSEDISVSKRFCQLLGDERERNEKFGRATAIPASFETDQAIKEALGSCVQTFGGIDVVVDALFVEGNLDIASSLQKNLQRSLLLSESILPFLKKRKRARLIYLMNEIDLQGDVQRPWSSASRAGLTALVKGLSQQLLLENIPVNLVTMALTEEYLLSLHPGLSIKDSLEQLRIKNPQQKVTEPDRVADLLSLLISTQGAALTGQTFHAK